MKTFQVPLFKGEESCISMVTVEVLKYAREVMHESREASLGWSCRVLS
jgi:hypothetical protein